MRADTNVVAVDTSVAVALLVASHSEHGAIAEWAAGKSLVLGGHALVETYSVLTRLPGDARLSAQDAVRLIDDNFAETLPLGPEDSASIHRALAAAGVVGGAAYDGLVALAARRSGVRLATRDARARTTYESLGVPVLVAGQPS